MWFLYTSHVDLPHTYVQGGPKVWTCRKKCISSYKLQQMLKLMSSGFTTLVYALDTRMVTVLIYQNWCWIISSFSAVIVLIDSDLLVSDYCLLMMPKEKRWSGVGSGFLPFVSKLIAKYQISYKEKFLWIQTFFKTSIVYFTMNSLCSMHDWFIFTFVSFLHDSFVTLGRRT